MIRQAFHFLCLMLFLPLTSYTQEINKDQILQAWDNSYSYSMEVAELMPDSLYDYKPTEEQMTFREQLLHMAGNIGWISHRYLDADSLELNEDMLETITPQTARKIISTAYSNARKAIEMIDGETWRAENEFFAGPMSGQQIVHLLFDHQTHHRGQLIVYLRLNGLKPPRYKGW